MSRKRTRNKRTRKRRDKGAGGASNRPSRTGETQRTDISQRVDASYNVLGHPQSANPPRAQEGTHYEVLAYTDWADRFIPTVIKWNHGEVDDLTDHQQSLKNKTKALAYEHKTKEKKLHAKGKPYVKYMFDRHGETYYGIYDPEQEKWLHMDGDWSEPYPEEGRIYYDIKKDLADQKLQTVKTGKPYVVELWSNQDDAVYKVNVVANSLADAEAEGSLILRERYPGHGSDVTAYTEES